MKYVTEDSEEEHRLLKLWLDIAYDDIPAPGGADMRTKSESEERK